MAEQNIKSRIVHKHDTEANWIKATNFIPKQGEIIVYDVDSTHTYERIKIGDGATNVNSLPFSTDSVVESMNVQISGLQTSINNVSELVGDVSVSEQINTAIDGISSRISPNSVKIQDRLNGYNYVVEMHGGKITSSCCAVSIAITTLPSNTNCIVGSLPDTTGMVVTATCEDDNTKIIECYTITGDTSAIGQSTITVEYEECGAVYTDTFNVNVVSVEDSLVDFAYTNNGDGTYTITGWNETLNGAASTEFIVPNSSSIKL